MPDEIRVDSLSGLTIFRNRKRPARSPVALRADGLFEVREPVPIPLVFARNSLAASLSGGGASFQIGTSSVTSSMLPLDSRLVGMVVHAGATLTAGTLTARVQRSGSTVTGPTLGLTTGQVRNKVWWGWDEGFAFASTDFVSVVYDTDAAFAPVGAGPPAQNVYTTLFFAMLP
jgi:hypothetical protein